MKPQLIINGSAGRMGRRLVALAVESGNFNLIAAIEASNHPDINKDAGSIAGISPAGIKISPDWPSTAADVVIDFSLPAGADIAIDYCSKYNCALVIGTTGLAHHQLQKIRELAGKAPVIQATNMSVGMNFLFEFIGKVATALGNDYDIEIVEEHHKFKKDAPSGTALTLAERIAKSAGWKYPDCLVCGRSGKDALRQPNTIGMHAIRAGDIVGEHSVIFSCQGETVTLSHSAHSRDTFVRGALRAAQWLVGKRPGLYSMKDVLGL